MTTIEKIVNNNQKVEVGEKAYSPENKESKNIILLDKTTYSIVLLHDGYITEYDAMDDKETSIHFNTDILKCKMQ